MHMVGLHCHRVSTLPEGLVKTSGACVTPVAGLKDSPWALSESSGCQAVPGYRSRLSLPATLNIASVFPRKSAVCHCWVREEQGSSLSVTANSDTEIRIQRTGTKGQNWFRKTGRGGRSGCMCVVSSCKGEKAPTTHLFVPIHESVWPIHGRKSWLVRTPLQFLLHLFREE